MNCQIFGEVEPGFKKVKEVFKANWEGYEVGASFSVVYKGKKVVDLWGGFQDKAGTRPWKADTLVNVYSTTKGMGSLAVAILAEEGRLDYKALVTDYWPEFGAEGKNRVTVAQLLSHQAGVCGVSEKIKIEDLYDWDKIVRLLAAQKPFWEPGRAYGYHAVTWGYLAGELIRRITGKTLGQYFHEKVAGPLGADFYIGLPDAEMNRVADMIGPNHARVPQKPEGDSRPKTSLYPVALQNPEIRPFKDVCSYAWRMAEIAAANGQANARGIARIYGALANGGEIDGIRIISKKAIETATMEEVKGDQDDLILGRPRRFARGFALNTEDMYGPNPRAFGHAGAGGSVGFADPDTNIAIGYAMNQMQVNEDDVPRAELLVKETYGCL
jgi:CubicO group peptidase (beta-lactamase class C family)